MKEIILDAVAEDQSVLGHEGGDLKRLMLGYITGDLVAIFSVDSASRWNARAMTWARIAPAPKNCVEFLLIDLRPMPQ